MKQFVAVLLISGSVVAILALWILPNLNRPALSDHNFVDALFITGIFMFFFSLMGITNASKAFIGMGYTLKRMFWFRDEPTSFYDYSKAKEKDRSGGSMGFSSLIISVTYLAIALIIIQVQGWS